MMPRISRAPGPRLVNVGDNNEGSIAADSPRVWGVDNKEMRRFSHSRSKRGESHRFWVATVARSVIESG